MKENKLDNLEERIEKPAYLLFVVVVLLFLIIGFVNLLDFESRNNVILGRYSIPYVAMLLGYLGVMLAWGSLLLRPNDDSLLRKALDFIQTHVIVAVGILVAFAAVFASMFVSDRWINLPAFQVAATVIMLLFAGLILFYRWGDPSRPQLWRKLIVYPLAGLAVVEIVLQALTFIGIAPGVTQVTDSFAPYSRVYYTEEGLGNGMVNSTGFFYPSAQPRIDTYRVLLLGDSFVQALQVGKDENLGVALQALVDETSAEDQAIEIIAAGHPDYGPGLYLNTPLMEYTLAQYEPDEVIAFFDLGNDFQTITERNGQDLFFQLDADGNVDVHPDDYGRRHDIQHEVLWGYEGFQLNRFLRSHYLTPRVAQTLLNPPSAFADSTPSAETGDISLPNGFVFDDATNDEALAMATAHIDLAHDYLSDLGIDFKLVTIPVFSDDFLTQEAWNTQFGASDLLLPEEELRAYSAENAIPFLGLGSYMAAANVTPTNVQTLYFNEGRGRFTPDGHDFAASAVYACFFAQTVAPNAGCDLP